MFLFDPDTGRVSAMVGGNLLTARAHGRGVLRCPIRHLGAQGCERCSGMVGAGHQAKFQLRAALETQGFEKVIGWNLHPEMLPGLAAVAEEMGVPFQAVELPGLAEADVIITITSQPFAPSLMAAHVSAPERNLACMGTGPPGASRRSEARAAGQGNGFHRRGGAIHLHRRGPARGGGGSDRERVT